MEKVETVVSSIANAVPSIANAVPTINSGVAETVLSTESSSSLLEQIYNNKTYVYIFLVVLVLAGIGIYLYLSQTSSKNSKDSKDSKDSKVKEDKSSEETKDLLNPNKDYYIVDPNGKTILINKYLPKILQTEMQEEDMQIQNQKMIQQQMAQQQLMQQQLMQQQMLQQEIMQQPIMINNQNSLPPPSGQNRLIQTQQHSSQQHSSQKKSQQRPKLSHPGEEIIPNVNLDEDDNIANQDLTQTEIDELKKQLEVMQRNQSAPITAENEGNTDAEF